MHRAVFLLGGLSIGAAVVRMDVARLAFRLLYGAAAIVAVASLGQTLGTGLQAAYPLGLQKNFAGGLLAMVLVVAWVDRDLARMPPSVMRVLRLALLCGLIATQSRGAIGAFIVVMVLWSLLNFRRVSGAVLAVPVALALAVVLSTLVHADSGPSPFTSKNSRELANAAALRVWRQSEIFGGGLRYFRAPGYEEGIRGTSKLPIAEPHSVLHVTLAESGVVGLCALVLLLAWTMRSLFLIRTPIATLAALLLLTKFIHGFVDIYWVAGTQVLPWLFVGMAVSVTEARTGPESVPDLVARL